MAASDQRQLHHHRHQLHHHSSSSNGTNKTDLRQQSPSSYREMTSSDLSFSSSSCVQCQARHVQFHIARSLVSSVSNFAFDACLQSIEWMHRGCVEWATSSQLQSRHRHPQQSASIECQCLHQGQSPSALSATSSLSLTPLYCCFLPLSPSSSPSSTHKTNSLTHISSKVTVDTGQTLSFSQQQRGPSTMSQSFSSVKQSQFWSFSQFFPKLILLVMLTLALSSHLTLCDTQSRRSFSPPSFMAHHRYPRITPEEYPQSNRTLTLGQVNQMNRQIRQPPINHNQFCGLPPLVPNANSNLQRNQKHYVFPVGLVATYMCDQGYKAVDGVAETRCIYPDQINAQASALASHVIFPDMVKPDSDSDHHVVLLNSGRSKNSKRLMGDLDEEPDLNANGHKSIIFPDKRKMSRKTDDDLIGSMYDATSTTNIDGRNSDLENDSVEYLEKRKQRMDMIPKWWPLVTLNCQRINCSDPGQVDHAKRTDRSEKQFYFNSNVLYQCEEGYETIGIPILTCRANGEWNRQPPKCRLKQCPELPQPNDGRILYTNERRTDSRAEYHCNNGFRLNALTAVRHCRQDDQWSSLDPVNFASSLPNATDPYQCVPVECPAPIRPHTGLRILNLARKRKFVPGDVIIYSCDSVKTKATAKCRPDGEWSRDPPPCPELNPRCPQLPHFPHGLMTVELNKANFSCFEGYELDGVSSISCAAKGVWSAPVPRCVLNLPSVKGPHSSNQSGDNVNSQTDNLKTDGEIANLEEQQQSTSNRLAVLLIVIGILASIVISIAAVVLCKMRNDKLQRQRWRNYFGHYHHRQSKTNIVMSNTYNNLNGSNGMPSGLSSLNSIGLNQATRQLLANRRTTEQNGTNVQHTFLQSSFSSSDENPAEGKSFNTGTISSEHARTVSTYADDTCPEDEYDEEEEEDEDLYSNASMLQKKTGGSQPIAASRRVNNSTGPSELTVPESSPMMLLTPNSAPKPLNTTDHIYSNVPHHPFGTSSSLAQKAPPILMPPPPNHKSSVPVTEL